MLTHTHQLPCERATERYENGCNEVYPLADGHGGRLLINLSEPFSTRPSDRAQIWHACADRDETGSHQQKLTNTTPEGFRGLFIDVCGMWDVCGMIQAGGR